MYEFDFNNSKVNSKRIAKNKVGVPDETSGSNGACYVRKEEESWSRKFLKIRSTK